jgi:hypothetical protein
MFQSNNNRFPLCFVFHFRRLLSPLFYCHLISANNTCSNLIGTTRQTWIPTFTTSCQVDKRSKNAQETRSQTLAQNKRAQIWLKIHDSGYIPICPIWKTCPQEYLTCYPKDTTSRYYTRVSTATLQSCQPNHRHDLPASKHYHLHRTLCPIFY